MDDCKMDFTSGRNIQGCKKVRSVSMRGKGRKVIVFSSYRNSKGTPLSESYVYEYVKVW